MCAQVARNQVSVSDNDMGNSTPVGYEFNERTYKEGPLLEACKQGDLLKQVSTGWRLCHPGERADGIALKFGTAGQVGFSIGIVGEMDGFVSLTPGGKLYTSATVNGGLQTDVVASFTPQVHCARPGRIRYNFMQ